jgi:putative protease
MREEKRYLIIPNDKKMNEYNNDSFILPLKDFSVGFDVYFNTDEINELSSVYNVSVIINKFIHEKDLDFIKKLLLKLDNIKYFFVEDFSLINYISKEKIVLYPNHIISNYYSVNYLNELGFNNLVVSNELTIDELIEIKENTKSNLFYTLISKNNLMYSKRELLTNYYDNYKINDRSNKIIVNEEVSNHELIIKEEEKATTIFNNKIFCANKYLDKLDGYNFIVNLSNIDDKSKKTILDNLNKKDLYKLIDSDYYFLENRIVYKVGDLK